MLYATPAAQLDRPGIDAVIFDMDGVLIDITRSIRVVNCLAVPHYLRTILGWPTPDDLLTSADIELFKNAGGFNDDVDLTYALVLFYIAKGRENPSAAPETLNVLQPNLNRFAARIKERGGGVKAAEGILMEHLTREDTLAVETDYRKHAIKKVFLEMFAGEHCQPSIRPTTQIHGGARYLASTSSYARVCSSSYQMVPRHAPRLRHRSPTDSSHQLVSLSYNARLFYPIPTWRVSHRNPQCPAPEPVPVPVWQAVHRLSSLP